MPAGGVATYNDLVTPLLGSRVSAGGYYIFKKGYTYTIEWTGVCTGKKLTRTYDFTALDTVSISANMEPPCIAGTSTGAITATFNAINYELHNNALLFSGDYNPNWTLANAVQNSNFNLTQNGQQHTFRNLPAGKYTIMLGSALTGQPEHCHVYKTVELNAYQPLKSDYEAGVICSPATTGQVATINTALGKPGYRYQIKLSSDPVSSYSAIQSSSVFVRPAGSYDIRILDSCDNSLTVSPTIGPNAPPSLTTNLTTCANSDIVITSNKIRHMRYKWYKQGTLVAGQTTNIYTHSNKYTHRSDE